MKTTRYFLLWVLVLLCCTSCKECDLTDAAQPDLKFKTHEWIPNTCTNMNEYLDTRNLYWAPVAGTANWVLLYWRPFTGGFFDCYGGHWYIIPGSETMLVSYRYMVNDPDPVQLITEAADEPSAVSYTEVTAPDGTTTTYEGDQVEFGRMASGTWRELVTTVYISQYGTYVNSYTADPMDKEAERNEFNNLLSDTSMEMAKTSRATSFAVTPFDTEKLRRSGNPTVLYKNGQAELINYPEGINYLLTDKPGRGASKGESLSLAE